MSGRPYRASSARQARDRRRRRLPRRTVPPDRQRASAPDARDVAWNGSHHRAADIRLDRTRARRTTRRTTVPAFASPRQARTQERSQSQAIPRPPRIRRVRAARRLSRGRSRPSRNRGAPLATGLPGAAAQPQRRDAVGASPLLPDPRVLRSRCTEYRGHPGPQDITTPRGSTARRRSTATGCSRTSSCSTLCPPGRRTA